jgi:hypothetical protein
MVTLLRRHVPCYFKLAEKHMHEWWPLQIRSATSFALALPVTACTCYLVSAGNNAQGKLVVSALFLPFSDEIIEAAVAEDVKKAPEAPEEVTQIAKQLEVAMAVQDVLTLKVQQVATDLQQKVRRY